MPPFVTIKPRRKLLDAIINTDVPEIPDTWSDDFKDFVKKCLKRDPAERYTIDQLIYEHPFLAGMNIPKCKKAF